MMKLSHCLVWASLVVSGASQAAVTDLGPKSRDIEFFYDVTVPAQPADAGAIHIFVPLPRVDAQQQVIDEEFPRSLAGKVGVEKRFGNRFWHATVAAGDTKSYDLHFKFQIRRQASLRPDFYAAGNTSSRSEEESSLVDFLKADKLVPVEGEILDKIRKTIPASAKTPHEKARYIYDFVIDNMEYKKTGTGWGNGDTAWACSAKYGNCTDFHALFTSLARAEKIPTMFEIGFPIASDKKSGDVGGYHCWVKFHLPNAGWVPVDASEAKKHPEMRDTLFGSQPADRILFTRGRDIELGEGHKSGPLNYFIYPLVEVGGKPQKVETKFRFVEGTPAIDPDMSQRSRAAANAAPEQGAKAGQNGAQTKGKI